MLSNRLRFYVASLSIGLLAASCPLGALAEETTAASKESRKELNMEEMRSHRTLLRTDLMSPSLAGIRGITYGLPGHHPVTEMEKVVEVGLKQLPVQVSRFQDLKSGETKPVDAFLQLKVLGAGDRFSVVELTLHQWCTLSRDPNITVLTITYTDQAVTSNPLVKDTAEKMINQFVIDFLKANNGASKKETSGDDAKNDKAADKKKKSKKDG
jgi:hypothetical protein